MTDSWDQMRKAKEDSYFDKKDKELLKQLATKRGEETARKSPITGEPMEQVSLHGVIIDRCPSSGGIWLDKGELEELVEIMKKENTEQSAAESFSSFFKFIGGRS